ncbi:MAG: 7-cyano-7-deazaguanine synthase [Desulfobulbaceae bacterium]|jgi:7-cyano-7-deazaguanine synthase
MSFVNLVSGGLDSTLIGVMAKEEKIDFYPLFIDYGQRAVENEWTACRKVHEAYKLPKPLRMNLSGFGEIIISGLTSTTKDIKNDAFTPGRNMLFLLAASAYAFEKKVGAVAIGLLAEKYSIFPDQTKEFLIAAEEAIRQAMGRPISITAPLADFSKADVIRAAKERNIYGTYSCHFGDSDPCGYCISCVETLGQIQKG